MIGHESSFFVLDSNIFIEAHRRYYAFDICPGFWDSLRSGFRRGHSFSVAKPGKFGYFHGYEPLNRERFCISCALPAALRTIASRAAS